MDSHREHGAVIGIDIGGTKVASGIVDVHGRILAQSRRPMVAGEDAGAAFMAVCRAVDSMMVRAADLRCEIGGIGICSPGPLDPEAGVVVNPPNLPCWRNFPLAARISERYALPVKVDNDANAAALAESLWGAGKGYRNIFYTCIGTGIGTGIIFDGTIYHGRTGAAGEGGHASIDYRGPRCSCGKPGCIEVLASGTGIASRARIELEAQPDRSPILLQMANGVPGDITCNMVGDAFKSGDWLARKIIDATTALLSLWLSNVVDLLDPDVIIVGGGVASMMVPVFNDLKTGLVEYSLNSRANEIPLLHARYGDDAGIAGGAALRVERSLAASQALQV